MKKIEYHDLILGNAKKDILESNLCVCIYLIFYASSMYLVDVHCLADLTRRQVFFVAICLPPIYNLHCCLFLFSKPGTEFSMVFEFINSISLLYLQMSNGLTTSLMFSWHSKRENTNKK